MALHRLVASFAPIFFFARLKSLVFRAGSKILLSDTSIMPDIPGLPALVTMLFTPAMELRSAVCTHPQGQLRHLKKQQNDNPSPAFAASTRRRRATPASFVAWAATVRRRRASFQTTTLNSPLTSNSTSRTSLK